MKKLLSLVAVMAFAMALTACGTAKKVDIGIVLPTQNEERWTQDKERFEAAMADTDYNVEILFSQGDSAQEATNIETLISKGMKVLIITAHDSEAAKEAVQKAVNAGVRVIAYDRIVDLEGVDFYVTFDSIVVGEEQGQFLIDQLPANPGTDNELYLFSGAVWEGNAPLFFRGAWSALQPKIKDGTFKVMNVSDTLINKYIDKNELTTAEALEIMAVIDTNWDPGDATDIAESHVTTYPPTKSTAYFIAPNDFTARAIRQAFLDGSTVLETVVITGQDADKLSVKSVQDGGQTMTILKDVRTLVEEAFAVADKLMKGETLPAATHHYGDSYVPAKPTNVVVVTQDNLTEAIIDSGYYTQAEIDAAGQ